MNNSEETLEKRIRERLEREFRVSPTINVVGNHVLDFYWNVDTIDPTFALEPTGPSQGIDKFFTIDDEGVITLGENVIIALLYPGMTAYFNPEKRALVPDGRLDSTILAGIASRDIKVIYPRFNMIRYGGGGKHSADAINRICTFGLQYNGPTNDRDIGFEIYLNEMGISHVLYPYLSVLQANIVISGRRYRKSDNSIGNIVDKRLVLRCPDYKERYQGVDLNMKRGTVLINSLKDENLGTKIVDDVREKHGLGIICCTKSTPKGLRQHAIQKGFIPIFDNEDITAYTDIPTKKDNGEIDYEGCARALKKVREQQIGGATRIYLTLGIEGSMCLDEDGMLYRMESYFSNWIVSVNGAGDSFAAGVAILEHMNRYEIRHYVNPLLTLQFSAAMATSKIAKGHVDCMMVDDLLFYNHIKYAPGKKISSVIESGRAANLLRPTHDKSHTTIERTLGTHARR